MWPQLRKSVADVTRRKSRPLLAILGIFVGVLGATAVLEATALIRGALVYTTDPSSSRSRPRTWGTRCEPPPSSTTSGDC